MHKYYLIALTSLLIGCSNSDIPTVSVSGDACEDIYYQRIMGDYKGKATLERPGQHCEWEMDIRIYATTESPHGCFLAADVKSTVEQYIIGTGDSAYQCFADNSTRTVFTDDTLTLPSYIDFMGVPAVSEIGPHFGDNNEQAIYYHLIDGVKSLARISKVTAENELMLTGNHFEGVLAREVYR